jgi:hypothetical protein
MFQIKIIDSRQYPDKSQQEKLRQHLEQDQIACILTQIKKILGPYSSVSPEDISVEIVDGDISHGTIEGETVKLPLLGHQASIDLAKEKARMLGVDNLPEPQCEKAILTITASKILHEAVHGLLESRPGTRFLTDLEMISGVSDEQAERATLLDEGIAHAVQGLYAKSMEPFGYLGPQISLNDELIVQQRKKLGKKLEPIIKEYFNNSQPLDDRFLSVANQYLIEVQKETASV